MMRLMGILENFRNRSSIIGRGGGGTTKREEGRGGGQVKLYPYKKGDGKRFSHATKRGGGHRKVRVNFNTEA